MNIKFVDSQVKFKEYYDAYTKVFYEDAKEYNEHYYPMYNSYSKLLEQYQKDKEILLYIEEDDQIIATLAAKDVSEQEATLEALTVNKSYRGKGYASLLLKEMEKRLVQRKVAKISLGARFRACNVYLKNGYLPTLLVQVSDFATIDLIKSNNKYNFEIVNEYQNDVCGAVFFKVDDVSKNVIEHFEKEVPTAKASYIFTKEINN